MTCESLLDKQFITSHLTVDDPWCFSHGSGNGADDLGAGLLYFALAYALRAQTCVCLGSGGGFVPRLMRQAQRDLGLEGSRTILVDAGGEVPDDRKIWGRPCWTAADSTFRTNYPEVEIIVGLTATAHRDFFIANQIRIDFLHIDADHHYQGVKQDWTLYSPLVRDAGVITLHDTVNYREPCGVYRLLDEIRRDDRYESVNLPVSYGTAIVRRRGERP
jgi:hypothetical protein